MSAFCSWSGGKDSMLALHRALAGDLLALGCRARVVCVDARFFDASFCGRAFDAAFLADLPTVVGACGEKGEFHNFVFDGPCFAQPVAHRLAPMHGIKPEPTAPGHYFVAELH